MAWEAEAEDTTAAALGLGRLAAAVLALVRDAVVRYEADLGKLDAISGDGDHGISMRRGAEAAAAAARNATAGGASVQRVLTAAGEAWSERAGGTSGTLWGPALQAAGRALGNKDSYSGEDAATAVTAFASAATSLANVAPGGKTMLDALVPFRDSFLAAINDGAPVTGALASAVTAARQAADATGSPRPVKARPQPLAEQSQGHPDPGAVSFALIASMVSDYFDPSLLYVPAQAYKPE